MSLSIEPMNYAVGNQSQVSTAYTDSMKVGGAAVKAANPVQYPNATVYEAQAAQQQNAQAAEAAYGSIAEALAGTTGYSAAATASTYSTPGSIIDVYA